jgi:hypothetical protein
MHRATGDVGARGLAPLLDEDRGASGTSMLALLIHLEVFKHVGRFLSVRDLPPAAIAHVAIAAAKRRSKRAEGAKYIPFLK